MGIHHLNTSSFNQEMQQYILNGAFILNMPHSKIFHYTQDINIVIFNIEMS